MNYIIISEAFQVTPLKLSNSLDLIQQALYSNLFANDFRAAKLNLFFPSKL